MLLFAEEILCMLDSPAIRAMDRSVVVVTSVHISVSV